MSLYVEIQCDVRNETGFWLDKPPYNYVRCRSMDNNNAQGVNVVDAKKEARRQKWVVVGKWACCPYCAQTAEGKNAIATARGR